MAFSIALVLAFSVANGHRIQPMSMTNRKPLSPSSTEKKAAEVSTEKHPASMIQEEMSLSQQLQGAFKNASAIFPTATNSLPPSVLSGMLLAAGLIIGLVCCLAQLFASCLPSRKSRIPYMHDGRVVYEWNQTADGATIYIRPPAGISKRDLDIRISSRHLRVGRKGKPSFLREETYDMVDERKSSWSLRSNGELQIYLVKTKRTIWPSLLLHKDKSRDHLLMNSKFKPAGPPAPHRAKKEGKPESIAEEQ